ncbi:MAG TPA: GNAT family N-acetyltransferase [Methylomirabilota bacterium]|jgi:hypothetical protein|nr:GNAT family N-acetyltransferase [Methylomirabilota bacterium]
MAKLELSRLAERPPDWDRRIGEFATKTLFHESAWLDFVLTNYPRATIDYFEIRRDGSAAGYFCALKVQRGFFHVYGSPLPGSAMYMGPVVDQNVDQAELAEALARVARRNGIARLELANDWLDAAVMREVGFEVAASVTHICPLAKDEASAWAAMRGTCRTRIRKAEKSGLVAEATADPTVVEHFYAYFREVLTRKGLTPLYDIERPRALMACLARRDRLFAVWVKHEGTVIGAGFYPHDDRAMYHWNSASDPARLHLCPNELLHWTAMKLAISRGISTFNIGGEPLPSRFSQKFGGRLIPYRAYRKSFVPLLEAARRLYHLVDRTVWLRKGA